MLEERYRWTMTDLGRLLGVHGHCLDPDNDPLHVAELPLVPSDLTQLHRESVACPAIGN